MATKEDIVKRGVNEFAKVEQAFEDATEGLTALEGIFHEAGVADMEKMNKIVRIIHRLRHAKGDLSKISAEVYDLHDIGTAMAKRNNTDIALPEGGYTTFGGGGR